MKLTALRHGELYFIFAFHHYCNRGDKFRTAFLQLGELQSLMHTNIPVLAVTATSTKSTLDCIVQRLGMENVRIVGMSPNRDNIHLSVVQNVTLFEFMQPIVGVLKDKGVNQRPSYFVDLTMIVT